MKRLFVFFGAVTLALCVAACGNKNGGQGTASPAGKPAEQEQDENARPELTSHIENPDQYDTVFIGFPTWWYDMPQALYSFFDEYDFQGKPLFPLMSIMAAAFREPLKPFRNWSRMQWLLQTDLQLMRKMYPMRQEMWQTLEWRFCADEPPSGISLGSDDGNYKKT